MKKRVDLREYEKTFLDTGDQTGLYAIIAQGDPKELTQLLNAGVDIELRTVAGESVFDALRRSNQRYQKEMFEQLVSWAVFQHWRQEADNEKLLRRKAQILETEFELQREKTLLAFQHDLITAAIAQPSEEARVLVAYAAGLKTGEKTKILGFDSTKNLAENLLENYESHIEGCAGNLFLWIDNSLQPVGVKKSETRQRIKEKLLEKIQKEIQAISTHFTQAVQEKQWVETQRKMKMRMVAIDAQQEKMFEEKMFLDQLSLQKESNLARAQKWISLLCGRLWGLEMPLSHRMMMEERNAQEDHFFKNTFLKMLEKLGLPLQATDKEGYGILDYAVYYRDAALVQHCLEKNLPLLRMNRHGQTPVDQLFYLPDLPEEDVVLQIISQRLFEATQKTVSGAKKETTLHRAIVEMDARCDGKTVSMEDKKTLVSLLTNRPKDMIRPNLVGETPYHLMLKAKPPLKHFLMQQIYYGNLVIALSQGSMGKDFFRFIGSKMKQRFAKARTPDFSSLLHVALRKKQFKEAEELLQLGADPFLAEDRGFTVFDIALHQGKQSEGVKLLKPFLQTAILSTLEDPNGKKKLRQKMAQLPEYPLDFSGCSLSTKQYVQLCNRLKENYLHNEINFAFVCAMDEKAVDALCALLQSPTTKIETLNLEGTCLNDEGFKKIAAALKKNHTLKVLKLQNNLLTHHAKKELTQLMKAKKNRLRIQADVHVMDEHFFTVPQQEQKELSIAHYAHFSEALSQVMAQMTNSRTVKKTVMHRVDHFVELSREILALNERYYASYCCAVNNVKSQRWSSVPENLGLPSQQLAQSPPLSEDKIKTIVSLYAIKQLQDAMETLLTQPTYQPFEKTFIVQMTRQLLSTARQSFEAREIGLRATETLPTFSLFSANDSLEAPPQTVTGTQAATRRQL